MKLTHDAGKPIIHIRSAIQQDIPQIARLISTLNRQSSSHIGYCGDQEQEIGQTLIKDWEEGVLEQSFIVAEENKRLIGVIGFDLDQKEAVAEVWGPFIQHLEWAAIANQMWEHWSGQSAEAGSNRKLQYHFFINQLNRSAQSFVEKLGAKRQSDQVIMQLDQERFQLPELPTQELTAEITEEFIALHDLIFPDTYYSGAEIVQRIQEHRKVFILMERGKLAGYIYVEVNPQFGESSIEFFAVAPENRGRGLGEKLLQVALTWIFSFVTINTITLCVDAENHQALHLYEQVGFSRKHNLTFYRLEK